MATNKFFANNSVRHYDFDPDSTAPTDVAWVDMSQFELFAFSFLRTVGTSDTVIKVLANPASDGSGTDVEILSFTNTELGDPDGPFDQVFRECRAEEIAYAAGVAGVSGVRYVSVNIALGTNSDEAIVTYIRSGARQAFDGLTADVIG